MTVYVAVGSFACKCLDKITGSYDKKRIFIDSAQNTLDSLFSKANSNTYIRLFTDAETNYSIEKLFSGAFFMLSIPKNESLNIKVLSTMCEEFSAENLFNIIKNLKNCLSLGKWSYEITALVIPTVYGKQSINLSFFRFVNTWKQQEATNFLRANSLNFAIYVAEAQNDRFIQARVSNTFNNEAVKALDSLKVPFFTNRLFSALRESFINFTGEIINTEIEFKNWLNEYYPKYEKAYKELQLKKISDKNKAASAQKKPDKAAKPVAPVKTNPPKEEIPQDNKPEQNEPTKKEGLKKPEEKTNINENYVFISYSHFNQDIADAFRHLLNRNGVKTWMAPGDIPYGKSYMGVIARAVKSCRCLALILSQDSQESVWVKKEVERAVNYKKTIIPIKIDKSIINEEFEIMISESQLAAILKIDENSEEISKIVNDIKALVNN